MGETTPERSLESWDLTHRRKVQDHPCYDPRAQHKYGRIHLPVALRCNIQCGYCVRDFDCPHESRPGVTSRVLTPQEALARLEEVMERAPWIQVIGIAGPGDPLANEETFETLELARSRFPHLMECLSTNGLLLPDRLERLHALGVSHLTVTLSAVDPRIGQEIVSWVRYDGNTLVGLEGASLLLSQQLSGIRGAAERGMMVKVNTVYIPGVNDQHLVAVAEKAKELGASVQNILPLIPQHRFAHIPAPSPSELQAAQEACARILPQMRHCRQCRADAVGKLGEDRPSLLCEKAERKPDRCRRSGGFKDP